MCITVSFPSQRRNRAQADLRRLLFRPEVVTNHPEHDPDIQLMPFFTFNTSAFHSLYSTFHDCVMYYDAPARFLVQYQHLTFYPMMVVARFSLVGKSYYYVSSLAVALSAERRN